MKIRLAYLSSRQRSSQISSKEVERIEACLLNGTVASTRAGYSDSFYLSPLAVILLLSTPFSLVAMTRDSKENDNGEISQWCCG